MKIKKILTMCCLILVSMVTFFGCATIDSVRIVNPDYSITDRLVVTLDTEKLNKSGKFEEVYNAINNDMGNFRNYVYDWLNEFKIYPEVYNVLSSGIKCETLEYDKKTNPNKLGIQIEFAGIEYFRFFYGLDTVTEELTEIMGEESYYNAISDIGPFITKICNEDYSLEDMGLFLYKYYMFNDNGLMSNIKDFGASEFGESYYDKYTNLTSYDLDDIQINQLFTYPDDRINSNADDVEVIDGMTFMVWDLSDKEDGFEMSIYYIAAKTTTWYVLGLIISVVAVVIIYFCIRNKHKKEELVEVTKQEIEKDER